jgi:hypothetical protein
MPQVSFSADIKPLFRAIDISHMQSFGVDLDNYTYMSNPDNANGVLATLSSHDGEPPTMSPLMQIPHEVARSLLEACICSTSRNLPLPTKGSCL